jgi:hypothetical protein
MKWGCGSIELALSLVLLVVRQVVMRTQTHAYPLTAEIETPRGVRLGARTHCLRLLSATHLMDALLLAMGMRRRLWREAGLIGAVFVFSA